MTPARLLRALAVLTFVLALSACGGGADPSPTSAGTGTPSSGGTGSTGGTGNTGSTGSTGGTGSTGSSGNPGGNLVHAGMGPSNATPTGAAWAWPQGVQADDPVKGDDVLCVPPQQQATPPVGHGGLVRVCLGFRNTGLLPITVSLPPGLIFVSDKLETQNGVVLSTTTIVVPPSTTTWYVPVSLYCLNLYRRNTLDAQDTYRVGPLTDDPSVLELLALLQDKQVPPGFDFQLQQMLWDITDNGGLTPEDRATLAALPQR